MNDNDDDSINIGGTTVLGSAALFTGLARAFWDGRRRGFWIGLGVASCHHLLWSVGAWWLGALLCMAAGAHVHWRRPS